MCVVSFDVVAHVNCLGSVLKCGCVNKHHDYAVFSCGYVNRHRPTIIEGIYDRCVILLIDWLSSLTIFAGFAKSISRCQIPKSVIVNIRNKNDGLFCDFYVHQNYTLAVLGSNQESKQEQLEDGHVYRQCAV